MKITKVNHTKSAVVVKKNSQEGILYKDPCVKAEDLGDYVSERSGATKVLYNVLNQTNDNILEKDDKLNKETIKGIVNSINKGMKSLLKNNIYDPAKVVEAVNPEEKVSAKDIQDSITLFLRKSLRNKKGLSEQLEKLMMACYGLHKLSPEELQIISSGLMQEIKKDYEKDSIKENVPNAIKHLNMVIQPVEVEKDIIFSVHKTSKGNKKDIKEKEKDAFRKFLIEYADLDDEKRRNMRRKLRRLVDLYFYGSETVIPKDDFDEWADHKTHQNDKNGFVNFVFEKDDEGRDKKTKDKAVELKDAIRTENIRRYRESMAYVSKETSGLFFSDEMNSFWIHHIENEVERIYAHVFRGYEYKLELGYLGEKVWKGIINLISTKYVALGKAVYNFSMSDLSKGGDLFPGSINEKVKAGISSFEYEQIKAEETIQRDTAVSVVFAAMHLSNAVKESGETDGKDKDIFELKAGDLSGSDPDRIKRNVLQYFGGQSVWDEGFIKKYDGTDIFLKLKEYLYAMRNESFHFVTENKGKDNGAELISDMVERDIRRASRIQKDKFYSNNLPMFYSIDDLKELLGIMYGKYSNRISQVPAFGSIFVRKNMPDYIKELFGIKTSLFGDDLAKWQSALYYLYKEIYYSVFLQDRSIKEVFIKIVSGQKWSDTTEEKAIKDFQKRIKEIRDLSMTEICQVIMTDYNQQNQGSMKKKTAKRQEEDPDIFKHYKMLLYKVLRETFAEYVSKNEFECIKHPQKREMPAQGEFLPDYSSNQYGELLKKVNECFELRKWYVLSRLLNPRQANNLNGSLRHYLQYIWDVQRRAKETGHPLRVESARYKEIIDAVQVVDLSVHLLGTTSNTLSDYFDDEEEYADYISNFLDYRNENGYEISKPSMLRDFCNEKISGETVGIFYDGDNPIINRNIILAKMYGNTAILGNSIKKVNRDDIKEFFTKKTKIESYRTSGVCKDIEEQKILKSYQEVKNCVEFRNLVEYSEIIDELYGKLVNATYIRERDLMYFQLGFHYTCLHNVNCVKPDEYCQLDVVSGDKNAKISNAILYQLAAIYTNGIPVYRKDGVCYKPSDKNSLSSVKIKRLFVEEGNFLQGSVFDAGREVFENMTEEGAVFLFRNYIDHFKYYTKTDRSMLDLYSEAFDRLFVYDMKYRKNVPVLLYNVLLSHFAIASIGFLSGTKIVGESQKAAAKITINKVESEKFTYKLGDGNKAEVPSRGERFLEDIVRILFYSSENGIYAIPDGLIKSGMIKEINEKKKEGQKGSGYGKSSGKGDGNWNKHKKYDPNHREFEKYEESKKNQKNDGFGDMSSLFAGIKLN